MNEAPKKRGGPGRGQGRKPLDEVPSAVIQLRVKQSQKEKLKRLGGPKWVRKQIDDAPEPEKE